MNIVAMAAQYLTPMIVDRIASSLGIQSPMVRTAIGAILPSILGALVGKSSQPDGLRQLTDVLGRQDPGILGNLGGLLGGSGSAAFAQQGSNALGSLLGSGGLSSLSGAVSKFSGVEQGTAKSLLGMLAPVAIGTLAKEQRSAGLDGAGLANLLAGQKDNIREALPKGFGDLLQGSGLLDGLKPTAAPVSSATTGATHARPSSTGGSNWMLWAAALAAIALGGWYWLGGGRQPTLPAVPKIVVNNQDVGAQFGTITEGLRGTLAGLKDEASAKAALPRLSETLKQLDTMNDLRGRMPAEAKSSLANYVRGLLPVLRPLLDKALASAGVGAVAKPVLDQIFQRLDAMSKT